MDNAESSKWITWWYKEVREITNDDVLILMDNCDGHECDVNLLGFLFGLSPKGSTSKYQTLELGLIARSKIRYCSTLLRHVVDNTLRLISGEHHFPQSSNSGKWGLRNGHLPYADDAMTLFNESWSNIS